MRPHVCLLLALAALARAASIPAPAETSVQKLLTEVIKDLKDKDLNIASEPELIEQSNVVKDIDNKLRKQTVENPIPVKVVVEEVKPALKASHEKKDCDKVVDDDDDSGIKRVKIDLKHPGEPQRQEHETQNPEPVDSEHVAVTKIKQMIQDSQVVFNNGFKSITDGINNWIQDHEPEVSIKESIDNLQGTMMDQIHKLNSTIQSYWNPEAGDSKKQENIKNVESGLKVLEDNFESGVETLSTGVQFLAELKSVAKTDAASTTAASASSNPFQAFLSNFPTVIVQNLGNISSYFQNLSNQGNNSAIAGAQSDEGVSTSRPSLLQGIQNLIRPGQSQQQGVQNDSPAPSSGGPIANVWQNVMNYFQQKPPQSIAPAQPEKPADTAVEGSNAVPASVDKPAADAQKVKPEVQPAQTQPGTIQQIIQKNPIVQGIAGAVQRIQHTVNNPEKPRDESLTPAQAGEKAGFPLHGGHRPGDENNNDVNGSSSGSELVKTGEPIPEAEKIPEEVEEEFSEPAEAA